MDREMLAAQLRDVDSALAEKREQIEKQRAEIAELEGTGQNTEIARAKLDNLQEALALYLLHGERLADELRKKGRLS
jgi:hypothetical protein